MFFSFSSIHSFSLRLFPCPFPVRSVAVLPSCWQTEFCSLEEESTKEILRILSPIPMQFEWDPAFVSPYTCTHGGFNLVCRIADHVLIKSCLDSTLVIQCMKWPVAHSPNSTWFWLELVGNCCERLKIIMECTNIQFCERLGHGWQFHPLVIHPLVYCLTTRRIMAIYKFVPQLNPKYFIQLSQLASNATPLQ